MSNLWLKISLIVLLAAAWNGQAAVFTWNGTGDASDAANWLEDGLATANLPGGSDDVVLNGTSTGNMTWNAGEDTGSGTLGATVASWTQTADYTGTVTFPTKYSGGFTLFTISGSASLAGGAWTHSQNEASQTDRLRVHVGVNLSVTAPAQIHADEKGFRNDQGPGASPYRQGASHGGQAGRSPDAGSYLPPNYGSIKAPVDLGSGAATSAHGGGAIWLSVDGQTDLDGGILSANGVSDGFNGGSSGGSVYLQTDTLVGDGTIRANGGDTTQRGAGGGGRVSVVLGSGTSFGSVTMVAKGGVSTGPGDDTNASAGTVYREVPGDGGNGTLIVNGNSQLVTRSMTLMPGDVPVNLNTDFGDIVVTNAGVLAVSTNTTLNLASLGNFSFYGHAQSTLAIPYTNLVTFPSSLTVSNYTLALSQPVAFSGDVTVENQGNLTHIGNLTTQAHRLVLDIAGDLTVKNGGRIDAQGRGYWAGYGPGKTTSSASSASHGGQGGMRPGNSAANLGATYGSAVNPDRIGSGGGSSYGGGAIILTVAQHTQVDGVLRATSADGSFGGSGSGGTINLDTGTLDGSQTLDVSAGGTPSNNNNSQGGGGGRLAVRIGSGDAGGVTYDATGGAAGTTDPRAGAAGTIYLEIGGVRTLLVDNGTARDTSAYGNATWFPPQVGADATISNELQAVSVTVDNEGELRLGGNVQFGNLWLPAADSVLDLNFTDLYVDAKEHELGLGTVLNEGSISWQPPAGSVVLIR